MGSMRFRITAIVAASVVAASGFASPAYATTPPTFDATYGNNGVATITMPLRQSASQISEVLIDSSYSPERSVAAIDINVTAGERQTAIMRYTNTGGVDTSFANGVGHTEPVAMYSTSLLIQADGKYLLSGMTRRGASNAMVVRRYLTTGQPDATFGTVGEFYLSSMPGREFSGSSVRMVEDANEARLILATEISRPGSSNFDFYFLALEMDGELSSYNWGNQGVREVVAQVDATRGTPHLGSMSLLSDGSVIAVGSTVTNTERNIVMVRLTQRGDIDTTYGGTGKILTTLGSYTDATMTSMLVLSDNSIMVAGRVGLINDEQRFYALAKFKTDGSLDSDFGSGGFFVSSYQPDWNDVTKIAQLANGKFIFPIVDSAISDMPSLLVVNGSGSGEEKISISGYGRIHSVAVQNDQKIVAAGYLGQGGFNSAVFRLDENGTPDMDFGTSGYRTKNFDLLEHDITCLKVLPQADGTALCLGSARPVDGFWGSQFTIIARLTHDGSLDPTFGDAGLASLIGFNYLQVNARDLAMQADGKIVVLAEGSTGNDEDVLVFRLNANGIGDVNFGNSGLTTYDSGDSDRPRTLSIQTDQKILVSNSHGNYGSGIGEVVRFLSSGSLDSDFGVSGVAPITIGTELLVNKVLTHAGDCAGECIVVVGETYDGVNANGVIARLMNNGSFDLSFSGDQDGHTEVNLNEGNTLNPYSYLFDVVVTNDNKYVALGGGNTFGATQALIRFLPNGSIDGTFGGGDGVTLFEARTNVATSYSNALVAVGDGFVVVGAGEVRFNDERTSFATAVRFTSEGALDTSFDDSGVYVSPDGAAMQFIHMAPIGSGQSLVVGTRVIDGVSQGIVMRMGVAPVVVPEPAPVVVPPPPAVVVPEQTSVVAAPPTESVVAEPVVAPTAPAAATAVPATQKISLVIGVSRASILKQLKLTVPKGSRVTMKIAKSSSKVCRVVKTQVRGTAAGRCRVSVTVQSKAKKKITKTLSFRVFA